MWRTPGGSPAWAAGKSGALPGCSAQPSAQQRSTHTQKRSKHTALRPAQQSDHMRGRSETAAWMLPRQHPPQSPAAFQGLLPSRLARSPVAPALAVRPVRCR